MPGPSLPDAVEETLLHMCRNRNLDPPADSVRAELGSVGEEKALNILREINEVQSIKTLAGFIMYKVKQLKGHGEGSPSKKSCFSSPVKSCTTPPATGPGISQSLRADSVNCSPTTDLSMNTLTCSMGPRNGNTHNRALTALGELEFRKAFLNLSYIGGCKVEDVLSVDYIRRIQYFPMEKFENELWNTLKHKNIRVEERRKSLDWDSGKTHLYDCCVFSDGSYRFKGPFLHKTRNHLQRVLGDDNVLNVKFDDCNQNGGNLDYHAAYGPIARKGILVGLRLYRFFVFKDGGKQKKKTPGASPVKCIFVRMESSAAIDMNDSYILSGKTMEEARCIFMHAHRLLPNVSKYMARFSLILSKTIKLKIDDNMESVMVRKIEDVKCKDESGNIVYGSDGEALIHTDGTGFISEDLALMVPKNLFRGDYTSRKRIERTPDELGVGTVTEISNSPAVEPPLLIQMRLFYCGFAAKGTLLVNRELPPRTIQVRRKSMIKVDADRKVSNIESRNSLEIVNTSNHPRRTYLSKNLIALLHYGGVPEDFFLSIVNSALADVQDIFSSVRSAYRASIRHGEMDDFTVNSMILCGIPLEESYLQYRLSAIMKDEMKDLRGGKLPISESCYLMGTVDPTGILKSDQVCVILDNGQISGKVLVYRNPGLHTGDIHILNAVYVDVLEKIVGNAKYGIFFPCKGPRALADEIAGGDYDGDMYWVSRNPQLLEHFKESDRWVPESSTDNLFTEMTNKRLPENLEDELFKLFLTTRFHPSYTVGIAADSWLALMDRLLTLGNDCDAEKQVLKENVRKLVNIYYDALDAPKKGGVQIDVPKELRAQIFPHFMGKKDELQYRSSSVLGKIFDRVESFEVKDVLNKEVRKLPCFEADIPRSSVWIDRYKNYKDEMKSAMALDDETKGVTAKEVIQKYKKMLYGGAEFEESCRNMEDILKEALIIYNLAYDHAKEQGDVARCSFAWNVAGRALCMLYAREQGEKPLFCCPSVLKEL